MAIYYTAFNIIPTGGATGESLVKTNSTDFATEWLDVNPSGGISSLTPWTEDIDAASWNLNGVGSVNNIVFTVPVSGATITIADGKTLTISDNSNVSGTNSGDQNDWAIISGDYGVPISSMAILDTMYLLAGSGGGRTRIDTGRVYLDGLVPSGGAINYVLKKNSGDDYDYSWQADASGGGGGGGDALVANPLSQFALTTSAQLAIVISDETGSGNLVFSDTPTLTTPILGVASATSVNKITFTSPATGATITVIDGKTLTVSDNADVSGTNTGDQSLWATISGNVGSTTANTATDMVSILSGSGGGGTRVVSDSLFIDGLVPSGGAINYILKKNSADDYDYSWQVDSSGGSSGVLVDAQIISNDTLQVGYRYHTQASGALTFTLPNTPADGSLIEIIDSVGSFASNIVTVAAGASDTIKGVASIDLDINYTYCQLVYDANDNKWLAQITPEGFNINQAFTAQTSVTVTHNFGMYPNVDVMNSSNEIMTPLSITHNSINDLTVTFTTSSTGTIVVTGGGAGTIIQPIAKRVVTLTDVATNVATNSATTDIGEITITQSVTFTNPTGSPVDGQLVDYRVTQGGSGSYTITWDSSFRFSTTTPSPTLSTTVGKLDRILFEWNSTASKWDCLAYNLGY